MILSEQGIRRALAAGELAISPAPEDSQYTTSAVDLTLGHEFHVWDEKKLGVQGMEAVLNLAEHSYRKTASAFQITKPVDPEGNLILPPYKDKPWHLLAMTHERVHLKQKGRLAARVEGRSSLARIGLVVHLTAPVIHAGFEGNIVLEMINFGPFHLKLVPRRTSICQLVFERLETEPRIGITTDFQGQSTSGPLQPDN